MTGIVGSVTNSASSAGAQSATLPQAGLTIVGISFEGSQPYITIPIDPSRNAVIPNNFQSAVRTVFRKVNWVVNGTLLNYSQPVATATTVTFYYGTPLNNSKPLAAYAGVVGQVTLSSGAGSVVLQFPSGGLLLTGLDGIDETADDAFQESFATSSGQSLFADFGVGRMTDMADVLPLALTTSQTLTVSVTGTGTDVIDVIAFYSAGSTSQASGTGSAGAAPYSSS